MFIKNIVLFFEIFDTNLGERKNDSMGQLSSGRYRNLTVVFNYPTDKKTVRPLLSIILNGLSTQNMSIRK